MAYNYEDELPEIVDNNGVDLIIREKCDYRIVKKVIRALKDTELKDEEKLQCALIIFYENYKEIKDVEDAVKQMFFIIDCGNQYKVQNTYKSNEPKPEVMNWDYDWDIIAPELNKVLGYDIRTPKKYTHWWTMIGAYMCVGEGTFNTVIGIRSKRAKGKKLDKWEEEYIREHREMVELPKNLTEEEQEWLDSDW